MSMAGRSASELTMGPSFEPSRYSNGHAAKEFAGSSSSLANPHRTPSSSVSTALCARRSWTCRASDRLKRQELRRRSGEGSTTRNEHTAHWASCHPASSRHAGSVYSLQLRLVQVEGYRQRSEARIRDYLIPQALKVGFDTRNVSSNVGGSWSQFLCAVQPPSARTCQ